MTRSVVLALAILLFFSQFAKGQEKEEQSQSLPIETLRQLDSLERAQDALKEMELLVERIERKKFSDCMKAFGNKKFCTCLRQNLPVRLDFAGYIGVVTATKDELGYSKADKETKQLIDYTLKSRDMCVRESQ